MAAKLKACRHKFESLGKYIKDDRFLPLFDDELFELSYKIYPELTDKVGKILK
jgi:hypothetical protein